MDYGKDQGGNEHSEHDGKCTLSRLSFTLGKHAMHLYGIYKGKAVESVTGDCEHESEIYRNLGHESRLKSFNAEEGALTKLEDCVKIISCHVKLRRQKKPLAANKWVAQEPCSA